jgi:hypothetical protein
MTKRERKIDIMRRYFLIILVFVSGCSHGVCYQRGVKYLKAHGMRHFSQMDKEIIRTNCRERRFSYEVPCDEMVSNDKTPHGKVFEKTKDFEYEYIEK